MNLNEVIEEVKGKLYERISSPFLFTYSLSFIIFNWRFIYRILHAERTYVLDDYLVQHPLDYENPFLYSIAYVLIIPILNLISVTYNEFVTTGTIYLRNYMRKNWQGHDIKTIASIENKYISEILALKDKINSEKVEYVNVADSLIRVFKTEKQLPNSLNIIMKKCESNLAIGDVALDIPNLAVRDNGSSGKSTLGIVLGKPGTEFAFIVISGEIPCSALDLRVKQSISQSGEYFLSKTDSSRLEYLESETKGNIQIVGELLDNGNFIVKKRSINRSENA